MDLKITHSNFVKVCGETHLVLTKQLTVRVFIILLAYVVAEVLVMNRIFLLSGARSHWFGRKNGNHVSGYA